MKISLALTFIILAAAAWIGSQDRQRLVKLQTSIERLQAWNSLPTTHSGSTQRQQRKERSDISRQLAADLLDHLREIQLNPTQDADGPSHEFQELMKRISMLDVESFKEVMATLRDATDPSATSRQDLVTWCMTSFAKDHPQVVLAMIAGGFDFPADPRFRSTVVNNTILRLASQDVQAAADWLRAHEGSIEGITDTKYRIVSAINDDPAKAFRFMQELDLRDPYETIGGILYQNRSKEKRTAALSALRDYLSAEKDSPNHARITSDSIRTIATYAAADGFTDGSKWITDQLSADELKTLSTSTFLSSAKLADAGKWMEWLEFSLPWDPLSNNARQLMSRWTQSTPEAAGLWLTSAKEGPARTAAIEAYAVTIAPHEPATAAQWALQLPPDKRPSVLASIHRFWPTTDPSGAAAFAEKHGIK